MAERPIEMPWSVPVIRDKVSETGLHVDLAADARIREAVAKAANVRAVDQLTASFDVTPHGRDGLRVVGTVNAVVGQTCVVSLEPLANTISEAVDLVFAPAKAETLTPRQRVDVARDDEDDDDDAIAEIVAPVGDDPPEPMIHGAIDLGAVATEFLILGIDPYPRKPGTAFEPPPVPDTGGSPFSALAALKPGKTGTS